MNPIHADCSFLGNELMENIQKIVYRSYEHPENDLHKLYNNGHMNETCHQSESM